MITLKFLKQTKNYLGTLVFLLAFNGFSQEVPVTSTNTEITTGITVEFAFDEEKSDTKNNVKERITDNDPDTDWAGNLGNATGEASIIINLGAAYNLAEFQYLTVAKSDPYAFQFLVSTTGKEAADFTDVFNGAKQQSNLDGTYKQFILPSVQTGVTYVKLICFGRINATTEANTSAWNTISEIKFYKEASTASTISNELSKASMYPIPANQHLNLKNINERVNKIEIFNVLGKMLISRKIENSNQTFDTSKLANGMYLVKFSDKYNVSASKMILIQH
ncbi:poly(beta-D-mannuronate) lyase [Lutibacter sp. Hel_I_33_5]|uniref:T9SS type A sorting domain-containing protein n=1 Tax=Lutibacter sp. Hel_I_33_5 TaxID=1566289 RepID=UPI00119EA568|nr:T9SS type A sorting domain-containing protein [Lutibacter sp. Hel_I_33_5]TVZ56901.1 poly(beta-D-mannuronate) lyase [Lutibacter sp. Hel_I_33_5]